MSHLELNKAIYLALVNDDLIIKYNVGVYLSVPINSNFPYIYMSIAKLKNISTKSNDFHEITTYVDIYTKNKGDNIHLLIIDRLPKIINKSNVKLKNLVSIYLIGYEVKVENNGTIMHLSSKFKSSIEV